MSLWLIPLFLSLPALAQVATPLTPEQISTGLAEATAQAWAENPYAVLAENYFSRITRNPDAQPAGDETVIDATWHVSIPPGEENALPGIMARYLTELFLARMATAIPLNDPARPRAIRLLPGGGSVDNKPGSYTITIADNEITIAGHDPAGMRDGVVRLVDEIALRGAPFLKKGIITGAPRLAVRLGAIPKGGTLRDLVFMGYNALFTGGGNLHALSESNLIPELKAARHVPGMLAQTAQAVADAKTHALKTYAFLDARKKFPKDDPIFAAHPELRGALTWKADGEYVLCTEALLMKQYLRESIQQLFTAAPGLDGVVFIVGGEGFYHCFMRPFGVEKGHTNCPRCEALGPDTVVANLCNNLAAAAREINPNAEVIAWPYSAVHVWSSDAAQSGFIAKLRPGTGIFSEIEKDEYVAKPGGINKHIWDYSIDLIGPGERAKQQIAACRAAGIPIYLKSEPEIGFEAPRLPHIPCMDRWADRANALASCGADGAWVFPAFRPNYGTSAAELNKYFWWEPAPENEAMLQRFAARIAGAEAGPDLREAWRHVSKAVEFSPELPPYYTGPYYLGPAQPMCANPDAELPDVFYGYYLFMAEITDDEGMKKRPTFDTKPRGDVPVFTRYYQDMETELAQAVAAIEKAAPLVPERCALTFNAEASPIRWFYHTARAHANFYESCALRDEIHATLKQENITLEEKQNTLALIAQWRGVLQDELENARAALPVMQADSRLDFRFGGDHTFSHGADMITAKIGILETELGEYLPALEEKLK